MSEKKHIITARELAEMLKPYGDMPVEICSDGRSDFVVKSILERGGVSASQREARNTAFGHIDVCRLSISAMENC